jgi:hypothetical protein
MEELIEEWRRGDEGDLAPEIRKASEGRTVMVDCTSNLWKFDMRYSARAVGWKTLCFSVAMSSMIETICQVSGSTLSKSSVTVEPGGANPPGPSTVYGPRTGMPSV